MDRALSFDVAHDARYRDHRRYIQKHVHMVRHDMPFLYPTLFVPRQIMYCLSQSPAYESVERSAPIFRDEYDVVFALPFCMSQAPPAKPEACELEPLKAAIVVR